MSLNDSLHVDAQSIEIVPSESLTRRLKLLRNLATNTGQTGEPVKIPIIKNVDLMLFYLLRAETLSRSLEEKKERRDALFEINEFLALGVSFRLIPEIFQLPTDQYFWNYLESDKFPELYDITRAQYLRRQQENVNFPLLRHSQNKIKLLTMEHPINLLISDLHHREVMDERFLTNGDGNDWTTKHTHDHIIRVVRSFDEIMIHLDELKANDWRKAVIALARLPGVAICGGAINDLVYPRFPILKPGIYQTTFDYDIFLYGIETSKIGDAVQQIIKTLGTLFPSKTAEIILTNNAISMMGMDMNNDVGHTYQIIKKSYGSLQEILLGFDIDSCRVAMASPDGNLDIYYTESYQLAVSYGINLITPQYQSPSFNYRAAKYALRGFLPFIPGAVHRRSSIYLRSETGHLSELIFAANKYFKLSQGPWTSDYSGEHDLVVEYRAALGRIDPPNLDLLKFTKIRKIMRYFLENNAFTDWRRHVPGQPINGTFNTSTRDYLSI